LFEGSDLPLSVELAFGRMRLEHSRDTPCKTCVHALLKSDLE